MSRYKLAARSLMSDSWLIWILISLCLLISTAGLLIGQTIILAVLAGLGMLGTSFAAWCYRKWEPSQLVPDMNSTYATVLVGIGLLFWSVVSLFILSVDGLAIIRIGLTLVFISLALWVGFGDRLCLSPILATAFIVSIMFAEPQMMKVMGYIWNLEPDRTQPWNGFFGGASVLVGFVMLWAFHGSASRKIEWNQSWLHYSYWFIDSELKIGQNDVPKSMLSRLNKRLTISATWSPLDASCLGVMVVVVVGLLYYAKNASEAVAPLLLFCSLLIIAVPACYFVACLPASFERLWITGVKESRIQTARALVIVALYRTTFVLAMLVC